MSVSVSTGDEVEEAHWLRTFCCLLKHATVDDDADKRLSVASLRTDPPP